MPHKFSHTKFGKKIMKKNGTKKAVKKAPKKKMGRYGKKM
jgi:hypothetical protein